jgi:hypothetical protein
LLLRRSGLGRRSGPHSDLRHFATTMLFIEGVPDAIIRKMTGHRSEELERYKHLSASFKQQSVELIAGQLTRQLGTKLGTLSETAPENTNGLPEGRPQVLRLPQLSGGADGTRTRDLRRDRLGFSLNEINYLALPSTI